MQIANKLLIILSSTLIVVCVILVSHSNNLQEEQDRQHGVLLEIKESLLTSQKHSLSSKDEVKTEVGSLQTTLESLKSSNELIQTGVSDLTQRLVQSQENDNRNTVSENFVGLKNDISDLRVQFDSLKGLTSEIKGLLDGLSEKITKLESSSQGISDELKGISSSNTEIKTEIKTFGQTLSSHQLIQCNQNTNQNQNQTQNADLNQNQNPDPNQNQTQNPDPNQNQNPDPNQNQNPNPNEVSNQNPDPNANTNPDPNHIPHPDSNEGETHLTPSEMDKLLDEMNQGEDSWLRSCVQETLHSIGEITDDKIQEILDRPVTYQCAKEQTFGHADSSQFDICFDDFNTTESSPCVIYGFGLSQTAAFEVDVARALGCDVHLFDSAASSYVESARASGILPSNLYHHAYDLGNVDGKMKVSESEEVESIRLATIMKNLNHEFVDYVKFDIEGTEIPVFDDVFSNNLEILQQIGQIAVVFHYSEEYTHEPIDQTVAQMECIFEEMRDIGFQIFHKTEISQAKTQTYHFIRSESESYDGRADSYAQDSSSPDSYTQQQDPITNPNSYYTQQQDPNSNPNSDDTQQQDPNSNPNSDDTQQQDPDMKYPDDRDDYPGLED